MFRFVNRRKFTYCLIKNFKTGLTFKSNAFQGNPIKPHVRHTHLTKGLKRSKNKIEQIKMDGHSLIGLAVRFDALFGYRTKIFLPAQII